MRFDRYGTKRGRWGQDLDLGDMSDESLLWRILLPWGEHWSFLCAAIVCLIGYGEWRSGVRWMALFTFAMAGVQLWLVHIKLNRRRYYRQKFMEMNAYIEIERVDGQEGP